MDARAPAGTELLPHYYRDNFKALCDTVEAQYGDLLTASEQAFLQAFHSLPFAAQCLYVRLVSRLGPWFRESKLFYPELGSIPDALDSLLASGMAEQAEALYVEELGGLYTVPELRQAFGSLLGDAVARTKADLLQAIEALALADDEIMRLLQAVDSERIIAPCGLAEVALLQLLFFGNRRQSLTEFVLSDLGVARYYPYPLDRKHRLFPHREAVEEYLACAELSDVWYELREGEDAAALPQLAVEVLNLEVQFVSSEGRWHRLCNGLARDLERLGELETAASLYECSSRHPARERRLRVLERLQDWPAAVRLAEQVLDEPWCEEERDAAHRVLPRVRRKLGGKPAPRQRDNFPRLDLELTKADLPVEVLAARQLEAQWGQVHYVENALMNALFGLAFWEQIFAPVPGAFHNPFQSVPTDMYSPDFRARRRAALATRMAELRRKGVAPLLRDAYSRYADFQCRWVDWRRLDEALLQVATGVIPDTHLLAVLERMLFDPRENRRGFPDLIALGEDPGEYCLIEVKGPGDALQESQKRWLRFFAQQEIPAMVDWVSWREQPDD